MTVQENLKLYEINTILKILSNAVLLGAMCQLVCIKYCISGYFNKVLQQYFLVFQS